MAIRFLCKNCGQLLSIGARKAGTEIRCPRCEAAQVVPSPEAAEAAMAMARIAGRGVPVGGLSPAGVPPQVGRPGEKAGEGVLRGPAPYRSGGGVFSRRLQKRDPMTLAILGLLLTLVAMFFFLAGYLAGRGAGEAKSEARDGEDSAAGRRVLM